jgi:hypothetical protein
MDLGEIKVPEVHSACLALLSLLRYTLLINEPKFIEEGIEQPSNCGR